MIIVVIACEHSPNYIPVAAELNDSITIEDLEEHIYRFKNAVSTVEECVEQSLLIERFAYYLQKKISWAINLPTNQPLYSEMNCGAFLQMYFKCRSKLKIS